MAFNDLYRLSAHAVIVNTSGDVLQLKATYGSLAWGLPGGALEPGETIHECVLRECREELGCDVVIGELTGVYFHAAHNSHVFIFRCSLATDDAIHLSAEHSEYRYFATAELSSVQRTRVEDCLSFASSVVSRKF